MDTIFTLNDDLSEGIKLNLDELYEKKQQQDLNTLSLYNRILSRIHTKIKTVSRMQTKEQFCWYVMPETIIGIPKFDFSACTAYIIDSLRENGFIVNYTHPNLLLVSWANWCPSYVRNEIKKKTGVIIDGNGKRINNDDNNDQMSNSDDPNDLILNRKHENNLDVSKQHKNYTPIDNYKPSGLIYNEKLLKTIHDKTR